MALTFKQKEDYKKLLPKLLLGALFFTFLTIEYATILKLSIPNPIWIVVLFLIFLSIAVSLLLISFFIYLILRRSG